MKLRCYISIKYRPMHDRALIVFRACAAKYSASRKCTGASITDFRARGENTRKHATEWQKEIRPPVIGANVQRITWIIEIDRCSRICVASRFWRWTPIVFFWNARHATDVRVTRPFHYTFIRTIGILLSLFLSLSLFFLTGRNFQPRAESQWHLSKCKINI